MNDTENDNVGIGTAPPGHRVDRRGNIVKDEGNVGVGTSAPPPAPEPTPEPTPEPDPEPSGPVVSDERDEADYGSNPH